MEEKMKKKIALFMVAALLLSAGLILSCGGDDDEKKDPGKTPGTETPATDVKHTVTFNPNGGTFSDGTTANKEVKIEDGEVIKFSNWPEDPERGTDALLGWFDGATEYKPNVNKFTKDITLTAKWDAALITVAADGNTAEHTNFKFVRGLAAHSGFTGTENGGNSFTITQGGIRYQYPVTPGFDYYDYDFVDVTYTASDINTVGGSPMVNKQYDTDGDYVDATGIDNGTDKVASFEIKKATGGGLTIQKWDGSKADMNIEVTKITFRKGTRYNITFDTKGGTALAGMYLVNGTKVRDLLPVTTTQAGKFLAGWFKEDAYTNAILSDTTVDTSFNNLVVKAKWLDNKVLTAIDVAFINISQFTINDTSNITSVELITDGFKQNGSNWNYAYAKFNITLPADTTLAHYDYVSFTLKEISGNTGWKNNNLVAGSSNKIVTTTENNKTSPTSNMKLTIIKPLAADLTGTISVGISLGGSGVWEITNVKFAQE